MEDLFVVVDFSANFMIASVCRRIASAKPGSSGLPDKPASDGIS